MTINKLMSKRNKKVVSKETPIEETTVLHLPILYSRILELKTALPDFIPESVQEPLFKEKIIVTEKNVGIDTGIILHLPIVYSRILDLKKVVPEFKRNVEGVSKGKEIGYKNAIDVIKGKTYNIQLKPEINLLHDTINSTNFKNTKTDIACWWCTCNFDTVPLGSPDKYVPSVDSFKVTGCFCSFNCILSYKMSKGHINCHLVSYMHKKLTNKFSRISKAPPPYCLTKFGGTVTIEKFRESFIDGSFIKILQYPMIFIPMNIIEGKPIDLIKKSMDRLDTLKKEPLKKIVIEPSKTEKKVDTGSKNICKILGFSSCT